MLKFLKRQVHRATYKRGLLLFGDGFGLGARRSEVDGALRAVAVVARVVGTVAWRLRRRHEGARVRVFGAWFDLSDWTRICPMEQQVEDEEGEAEGEEADSGQEEDSGQEDSAAEEEAKKKTMKRKRIASDSDD